MLKRALATFALVLVGAVGVGGSASALEVSPSEGVTELNDARKLLDDALELHRAGNFEDAYTAARNSYLDHFELVEIPLRVRDEGLTLELEERYADLRNMIQDEAPYGAVREKTAEVRDGLDEVERVLSEPGLGAPTIAFAFSFITLFREGLEAVLVVAAILGFLAASRNERYRPAVLRGVALALVASVVSFVLITAVIRLAPVQRELLEVGTTIAAVAVLFYVSFWLFARIEQRRWMEFLNAKVFTAAATGSSLALTGVGFTAIYREGLETSLFYQALLLYAEGLELWVLIGALVASAVLFAIGMTIFRAGRKVPTRKFLGFAVILIMVLSVAFIGNAVRGLQQAAFAPIDVLDGWPRLPIFLSDLLGYHPTAQTLIAQAALSLIYIVGGVVMLGRTRRAKDATGAAPESETAPV